MSNPPQVTVETLEQVLDAFNRHDLDSIMERLRRPGLLGVDPRTAHGKKIEVRGCDLFEFESGRISRKDSFWKIVE